MTVIGGRLNPPTAPDLVQTLLHETTFDVEDIQLRSSECTR